MFLLRVVGSLGIYGEVIVLESEPQKQYFSSCSIFFLIFIGTALEVIGYTIISTLLLLTQGLMLIVENLITYEVAVVFPVMVLFGGLCTSTMYTYFGNKFIHSTFKVQLYSETEEESIQTYKAVKKCTHFNMFEFNNS